ncbi:hypothetical protein AB1N83_003517 [Pleurotus pulmonarius]
MERITWIIIWLIVVACLVELGEVIARLVVHATLNPSLPIRTLSRDEALRTLEPPLYEILENNREKGIFFIVLGSFGYASLATPAFQPFNSLLDRDLHLHTDQDFVDFSRKLPSSSIKHQAPSLGSVISDIVKFCACREARPNLS